MLAEKKKIAQYAWREITMTCNQWHVFVLGFLRDFLHEHLFFPPCSSNGEKNPRVKHYQIRQTETGEATFYLAEKYLFNTIPELIHYHQHNAAGKCAGFPHATLLEGNKGSQ